MRVLVTAAGSGPGVAVIKAIRRGDTSAFVLAVDMRADAAGLYLADAWTLVPAPSDPTYVSGLLELCARFSIRMLVPIFDTETPVLAAAREQFAREGVHVAVNASSSIRSANDKAQSFDVCEANGILQPTRYVSPSDAPARAYPLLGKPIAGVGGQGVIILDTPEAAPPCAATTPYIWQQFVHGEEFSIDTFGAPDTAHFVAVPRLRRVVRSGQMVKGHTCGDRQLIDAARAICRAFGVHDVSCVQVIRTAEGAIYFVEINPRYGTGVSLSIRAGVNFPRLQWLSAFAPELITPEMLIFELNIEMIRYWEEVYRRL